MATQQLYDNNFKNWEKLDVNNITVRGDVIRETLRINQATSTTTGITVPPLQGISNFLINTQSYNLAPNAPNVFEVICADFANDDVVQVSINSMENNAGTNGIPLVIKKSLGVVGKFELQVVNCHSSVNLTGALVISVSIVPKRT